MKIYENFTNNDNLISFFFVKDFERHDDDELGFRKNDIINIISQKDEHCWVGELNGLRGNFSFYNINALHEKFSVLVNINLSYLDELKI